MSRKSTEEIDAENQLMAEFLARPIATKNQTGDVDSMFADDKKWKHPNWKLRWLQRLSGAAVGFITGIIAILVVLKILGRW